MKIIKPSISNELETVEDLLSFIESCKEEELDITTKKISGVTLVDMDLSKLCFKDVVFENCKLINCLLVKTEFVGAFLKNATFPTAMGWIHISIDVNGFPAREWELIYKMPF